MVAVRDPKMSLHLYRQTWKATPVESATKGMRLADFLSKLQ